MTKLIPADAQIAAQRGFIRTTSQALAATLATGISVTVVTGLATGEVDPLVTGISVGVSLVTPLIAGAASYFSILSRGIPEEYAPEIEVVQNPDGSKVVATARHVAD